MIKKSILIKEKNKELRFFNSNIKYNLILNLLKLNIINLNTFLKLKFQIQKLNIKLSEKRKRCFKTGRSRSFISFFGLGRHSIKEFFSEKLLPGLKKSSW